MPGGGPRIPPGGIPGPPIPGGGPMPGGLFYGCPGGGPLIPPGGIPPGCPPIPGGGPPGPGAP